MAYVERGVVKSKRTIWRLRTLTDFFWSIVNFVRVFFMTMFSMEKSDGYKKSSGSSNKWGGGGPGGGPYGNGPRGPPRGLDNVRGIDHSSLPACGSCCGDAEVPDSPDLVFPDPEVMQMLKRAAGIVSSHLAEKSVTVKSEQLPATDDELPGTLLWGHFIWSG